MNKRLWKELHSVRSAFWLTVLMQVCSALFLLAQAWAFSQIINHAFLLGTALNSLENWFLLALFGIGGRALSTWLSTVSAANIATAVKVNLRRRTMTHLLELGPVFIKSERSGEIMTSLTDGVEKLDQYFREYLPSILSALLIPLCIIIVIFPLDFLTFVVMLLTAPLIPLFMALIGMAAGVLARRQHVRMSFLGAHFFDVMQGLTTLKMLNRSEHQVKTIRQVTDDFRRATMDVLRVAFLSALSLELLATLSVAIVAVEIGIRLLYGGIAFEHALFLLMIAPEYYMPLRTLGARFHSGTEGAAAAERLYALLDNTPIPASSGQEPVTAWQTLYVDDVHFAYTAKRVALKGISLTISRGQHIAVIGESGSGKTTLSQMILRFLAPEAGVIYVDGLPLDQIDPSAWREQIAWVSQKPYLFNASIEENIRIGNRAANRQQVIEAAKAANAHDFITNLPEGYATPCGEHGYQLSGGQAQRIAIARAFLKDAPFIILDEPTANLDAASELHVLDGLRRLAQGRTVLSIAHRLDTVRDADVIYLMADGRIIEYGDHHTLTAQDGVYAQMRRDYA